MNAIDFVKKEYNRLLPLYEQAKEDFGCEKTHANEISLCHYSSRVDQLRTILDAATLKQISI